MSRRLVSQRRRVVADLQGDYHALWERLAQEVTSLGAHAWRFVADRDPETFVEFLEFASAADPRLEQRVVDVLRRLDAEVSTARVEEWRETPAG